MEGAATAGGEGTALAGIPGEATGVDIDGMAVRLWRAVGLEAFVDRRALLSAATPSEPPYWMHLWPGAMAVARRIASAVEVGPGARVLELGCGLALPALVAARRGAAVVASDWKREPLRFAARSAALNGCALGLVQMDWTTPALGRAFEVCIGADIGYDLDAQNALVQALGQLVAPGGVACLADSVNTARSTLAARCAAAGLAVDSEDVREWEEGRPVWVRLLTARRPR